jgi:hypothetical protein
MRSNVATHPINFTLHLLINFIPFHDQNYSIHTSNSSHFLCQISPIRTQFQAQHHEELPYHII